MAELPGWDRARLAIADPADVAAARWMVYARVTAEDATFDYPGAIRHVEVASIRDPKRQEREQHADQLKALEGLRQGQTKQKVLRSLLLLDDVDEPEDGP